MSTDADVLVYGATGAGVTAAVAAAREGARVTLVEPGRHVGGMVSGGLSHTDFHNRATLGGLLLEFHERVGRHYNARPFYWRGPEPHVAEKILRDWLREAGGVVQFGKRVAGVTKTDGVIREVKFTDGERRRAKIFVDASYEGDLLARAGVSYAVGREGRAKYGESLAGRRPFRPDGHQFKVSLSPFVNGREGALLPLIHQKPPAAVGEGDGGVQGYCFRFVMTKRADNRVPFARPAAYDPAEFELFRRFFAKGGNKLTARLMMSTLVNLPNEKCEVNSIGPLSTMPLDGASWAYDGASWAYPEGDYEKRDLIWRRHLEYTQGLMWFLANDPGVPEDVRREFQEWGLCKDEFADTDHWPHQLYVREGRRMIGEYMLTERDLMDETIKYDGVAVGCYNVDVREVQRIYEPVSRYPDYPAEVFNEGYMSVPVKPYEIPYRALLPRYGECRNLLVPVAVSASHVAFNSVRMEPTWMMLGHAAGVAAAMAAREGTTAHHVSVRALQERLGAQRQILSLAGRPAGNFQTDDEITLGSEMPGLVEREGDGWTRGHASPERFAYEYFENRTGRGAVRFKLPVLVGGEYEVFAWWPAGAERAERVPIEIRHADGLAKLTVNQREQGGRWVKLGQFRMRPGLPSEVGFIAEGVGGAVVADSVKAVRLK